MMLLGRMALVALERDGFLTICISFLKFLNGSPQSSCSCGVLSSAIGSLLVLVWQSLAYLQRGKKDPKQFPLLKDQRTCRLLFLAPLCLEDNCMWVVDDIILFHFDKNRQFSTFKFRTSFTETCLNFHVYLSILHFASCVIVLTYLAAKRAKKIKLDDNAQVDESRNCKSKFSTAFHYSIL